MYSKLSIKGHATKGEKVIKILEMLGGRKAGYGGGGSQYYYYIDNFGNIIGTTELPNDIIFKVFTLEEFLEKYSYKVHDKVRIPDYESEVVINKMKWDGFEIAYGFYTDKQEWCTSRDLIDWNGNPYKEEIMEEKGTLVEIDLTKELKVADEVEVILGDYEFVLKDGKTYFIKKQPKYPKTYEECCKVLLLNPEKATYSVCGLEYKRHLIVNFQRLLVCRDAYWKIAGNWKPNFTNYDVKFIIADYYGKVYSTAVTNYNRVLVFPTEEIRDAFYENFKELIEECKELL